MTPFPSLVGGGLPSADVEVLLAVVAVVAEVEDLVVDQPADGPLSVGLVGDMHPARGAAGAGVAEVELEGVAVVGDGAGDARGQAAFGLEPLPAVQDLLAGVDPQFALGEPGVGQGGPGLVGLVGVLEDGDQETLGVEDQRPFTSRRVLVGHARRPDDFVFTHGSAASSVVPAVVGTGGPGSR